MTRRRVDDAVLGFIGGVLGGDRNGVGCGVGGVRGAVVSGGGEMVCGGAAMTAVEEGYGEQEW